MIGWNIGVYRQTDDGSLPATSESATGTRLAVWQTGLSGLDWIMELVKAENAIDLGGNGYPCRYTATAGNLVPQIIVGPPGARAIWLFDDHDVLTEKWEGKTVIDQTVVSACRQDEWLLVEAWDES